MSRRNVVLVVVVLLLVIALGLGAALRRGSEPPTPIAIAPRPPDPVVAAAAPRPRSTPAPVEVPPTPAEVRCAVGRALEGRVCQLLTATASDDPTFTLHPHGYDGANLTFTANTERADALLRCRDVPPIAVTWTAGPEGFRCTVEGTLPPPADAPLSGKVRGAADLPEGTVFLEGCGALPDDPVDADGGFFVQTSAGRCAIRAWRQSGALRLPGPWTEVEAIAGVDVDVDLSVPTFEPAGMGIGFQALEDGIGVTLVRDGSPAAGAGLARGDVILRIDGVPTDGMDTEGFLQAGIGPAGSAVHLEGTTAEGEPFEVTLTRRPIDPG